MKNLPIDELVVLGRSWAQAPELTVMNSSGFVSKGYDLSEKTYRLIKTGSSRNLSVKIAASADSPLYNPAILVENWGDAKAIVKLNGKALKDGKDFRQGLVERMDNTHLVIWLNRKGPQPVEIEITIDK